MELPCAVAGSGLRQDISLLARVIGLVNDGHDMVTVLPGPGSKPDSEPEALLARYHLLVR